MLLIQETDTELGTCVAHTELFKAGQDTCTPNVPSCHQTNQPSRYAGATSRSPAARAQGGDTQAGPLNTARISLGCVLDLEMDRTVLQLLGASLSTYFDVSRIIDSFKLGEASGSFSPTIT